MALILLVSVMSLNNFVYTQDMNRGFSVKEPAIIDPNLKTELIIGGFSVPTSMAFLGPDHILITEKNTGKVKEKMSQLQLLQREFFLKQGYQFPKF